MKLGEIRNLMQEYDQKLYLRKLFYGDHQEALYIRNHLNTLSSFPAEHELSSQQAFNLAKILDSKSHLKLIQSIINKFNVDTIRILNILTKLDLANENRFISIEEMPYTNKDVLLNILSERKILNLNSILASSKLSLKEKVVDVLFVLCQTNKFPIILYKIQSTFKLLVKNKLLNEYSLDLILKSQDKLIYLINILEHLDHANLLLEKNLMLLSEYSNYWHTLNKLLSILNQAKPSFLDNTLLTSILEKSSEAFWILEMTEILLNNNCLNKKTFEILLSQDFSFSLHMLPVIKALTEIDALDDLNFQLICNNPNINWKTEDFYSFKVFKKYNLFGSYLLCGFISAKLKNVTGLSNTLHYLEKANIESSETVKIVKHFFLDGNIKTLSTILSAFDASDVLLEEKNFLLVCASTRIATISELFNRLRNGKLANNKNLVELLLLPDNQFDLLSQSILKLDAKFTIDQEVFNKLKDNAISLSPISSEIPVQNILAEQAIDHDKFPIDNQWVLNLLAQNFYQNSQHIIESHYLQPLSQDNAGFSLPQKIKTDLKDGFIERELHGGMHAGRVQFYTKILHEKLKEIVPAYVKENIAHLSSELGLNEEQIILLVRYAALFHDSARKNESCDFWDEESAKNGFNFLISKGLSADLAAIFAMAASCKDHPQKYENFLLSKKINPESFKHYHYLRKLIYMSDCLDIMRCVSHFKLEKIFTAFSDVNEYQPKQHNNDIIKLAEEIHQLISHQKDMLYDCTIILPDEQELKPNNNKNSFSIKEKLKFEHAENVCSVLGKSIKDHSYFTPYLKNEVFLSTDKAFLKPAFNPYIHGTNAMILSILERTNLSILSPVAMLEQYGLAPMGGEITRGGLDTITARCNPCFGRMNSKGVNDYTLNKIVNGYTHHFNPSPNEIRKKARIYVENSHKYAFSNINIVLIFLARAKQSGLEAISKEETNTLVKQIEATIQIYYLIMLLGKHIYPNFELLKTLDPKVKEDIYDGIHTFLTFEHLLSSIMSSNLNIKEIYENPSKENLSKLISLLSLPKEGEILSGFIQKPKFVSFPETQLFTLDKNYPADLIDYDDPNYFFYRLSQNCSSYSLNTLLERFTKQLITPKFFEKWEEKSLKQIKLLQEKLGILNNITNTAIDVMKFSARQQYFLNSPFPLLLLSEAEEKMDLTDFTTQEFRAKEHLKIGADIKMIATDTEERRLAMMKYLEENHIFNTQVILFDQLFKSQIVGKTPQSPYTHEDGFPKLSWLAAKKTPTNTHSEDPEIQKTLSAVNSFKQINFNSAQT